MKTTRYFRGFASDAAGGLIGFDISQASKRLDHTTLEAVAPPIPDKALA
jgi:hypothetical protein